jgi:hypothetical protein
MSKLIPTTPILDLQGFTESTLDGKGVLDVLLTTFKTHLAKEYDDGKIMGHDYATLFLQGYLPHVDSAIKLLLEKEKQPYELELLTQQADLVKEQAEAIRKKLPYELELLTQQADLVKEQADAIRKKLPLELEYLKLQNKIADAEIKYKEAQVELAKSQVELAKSQIAVALAEIEIKREQLVLTKQKTITEKAQTDNSVVIPGSAIWWQNKAIEQQVKAFEFDSQLKIFKILVDTWITRKNADEGELAVFPNNILTNKLNEITGGTGSIHIPRV